MTRFTTVNDVIEEIRRADPGFDELTDDALRDIVQGNRVNRYEQITDEEFNTMVAAAYIECGIDGESAEQLANG